jgi:F0F1-type ATP synthase gamma subunit
VVKKFLRKKKEKMTKAKTKFEAAQAFITKELIEIISGAEAV